MITTSSRRTRINKLSRLPCPVLALLSSLAFVPHSEAFPLSIFVFKQTQVHEKFSWVSFHSPTSKLEETCQGRRCRWWRWRRSRWWRGGRCSRCPPPPVASPSPRHSPVRSTLETSATPTTRTSSRMWTNSCHAIWICDWIIFSHHFLLHFFALIYDEYSDIHDVVLLIRLLRHLPRFPDGDRCGSMETDTGIDDEGNARTPIIYSPCSLIPRQPISYLSPILQPGTKVAKPFLGGSLSGTLCGGVKCLLSILSG